MSTFGTVEDKINDMPGKKIKKSGWWAMVSICLRRVMTCCLGLWLAYLSYPVVQNILSPSQVWHCTSMHTYYMKILYFLCVCFVNVIIIFKILFDLNVFIVSIIYYYYFYIFSSQGMNVSFDSFRIVNSYGAFGSITKVRHEVSDTCE